MTIEKPLPLYRNKEGIWVTWDYLIPDERKKEKEKIRKIIEKAEEKRKKRQASQFKKLRRYLREIKKTPFLEQKEEGNLWKKIAKKGEDKELEERIFKARLKLVVSTAKKYYQKKPLFTLLELIEEGEKGLQRGIEWYKKKFKEKKELRERYKNYKKYLRLIGGIKGVKPSTWVDFWIKPNIEEKIRKEMNKIEYERKDVKYYYDLSEEEKQKMERFYQLPEIKIRQKVFVTVSTHSGAK